MDNSSWLLILIIVGITWFAISRSNRKTRTEYVPKAKQYGRRDYIMTAAEGKLFRRLEVIAGDRYYVFPQIHLSSLLYHKIKGQDWRAALSAIQRKSVDFVLVDKTTLKTMYAVELDDRTHDWPDRVERDVSIAKYLVDADIPLVRLRNLEKLSDQDIENAFRDAHARKEC